MELAAGERDEPQEIEEASRREIAVSMWVTGIDGEAEIVVQANETTTGKLATLFARAKAWVAGVAESLLPGQRQFGTEVLAYC